jgi:nicotinamidase-related amidase
MGVTDLVITGVATDMCVFGTARVAAELGYNSLICEDACATYTARAHEEALLMHARVFGKVASTEDVLAELDGH